MPLPVDDLEALWERLADAIDAVGPERDRVFLAKLAIVLAQEIGDARRIDALISVARADL
jgi:hypothetical protein